MSDKNKKKWMVWFKPGRNGWTGILARRPFGAQKSHGEGRNTITLGWNGERFASGVEYDAYLALDHLEQDEIMAQIAEAREAGWLR